MYDNLKCLWFVSKLKGETEKTGIYTYTYTYYQKFVFLIVIGKDNFKTFFYI